MKGYSSIVRFKFRTGILLGLLAAVAILATDITSVSYQAVIESHAQADDTANGEDQDNTQITAEKNLVASVSQLTIHHGWHFIAEIYFDDEQDRDISGLDVREYNTWFRTLFRTIISPNAP